MKKYLLVLILVYSGLLFGQGHHTDTSFVINKQAFRILTKEINSAHVTLTIYRNIKIIGVDTFDASGLSDLTFPDFDKDGNRDIMLTYIGNNFTYYLYLFDKKKNVFRFVEGFDRFPEALQLQANPNYYYSYYRAGCIDRNWISDLFFIADFKSIHIGRIYGKGCTADPKNEPQLIEVYKITGNTEDKKKFLAKLPYKKNIPEFGDKWDFIKKYWGENYTQFIHQ